MSDPDMPTDDKYVVIKTAVLSDITDEDAWLYARIIKESIKDAVVIRRQDKFASPCLLTYAAMIGMVGSEHPDPKVRAELLDIADYFQRQGELAGDEGFKLPDL